MAIDFPANPEVGDTHQTAGTIYTWTGNRWTGRSYSLQYPVPIYTNMVLTTPRDPDPELAGVVVTEPEILETQEQVNDLLADAAKAIAKNAERVADAVDFSQNTIGKGYWTHELPPESELFPRPGEFWTNGNETDFGKITEFKFNDTGLPGNNDPGSLQGTREGDYLLVQCNGTNNFGYYVITGYETENLANQIIRTFTVKRFREERFKGATTEGVRHTVSTLRPVYTIVADEQPVVSTRGLLWYRESDDHLFISNYGDGFIGEGPQWTDLTAGDVYLPLAGGAMKGDIAMSGHKVTGIGDPKADSQAANKSYVDTRLMRTGGTTQKMEGILYLGGNKIAGVADPERSDDAATRGFVEGQIAAIPKPELELSTRQRMYLQGFYPWRFAEGTNPSEGEWVAKTYDYNVVLEPASWKMLYFSVVDAYGQDLAGKFLNHMDIDDYRPLQMWFAREDGTKICSYIGRMKCRDQNFEERFTVDMDASDKQLVTSPKWDSVSLEITRGEVIWIKCSAWGN